MKLTENEKKICKIYSARDNDGYVHCNECPLNLSRRHHECYVTVDGRTEVAKKLKRV